MQRADVVVVGGGPAGSSCAERLVAAGMDVLVIERARFPRDKPCAGWITPEVVRAAGLELAAYARSRTLQPIRRFRVGWIGGGAREVDYREPVSFGMLRRELDAFLLERSGARVCVGGVAELRRARGRWIVNERIGALFLVGAGGHFCPVARVLKSGSSRGVVVAQELVIRLTPAQSALCRVDADRPELDFTSDLNGYGWCFRKGDCLNVGLGRRDPGSLETDLRAYVDWLTRSGRIPMGSSGPLRSHAYRLREGRPPRVADEGVLLAGDAAGLAQAAGGEGILPAIQSGHVAAQVILDAVSGRPDAFDSYPARLAQVLAPRCEPGVPGPLRALAGRALLSSAWLTRHLVLERPFPQRPAPALVGS